jgi:hypothetical protein
MNLSFKKAAAAAIASSLLFGVACSPGSEDDSESGESFQTESAADYDFQIPAAGTKMVRIDAMGVALLSTVLMNRDRTPSGEDNKNQYQIDTPDVQNNPKTLLGFVHFLRALHKYWHDSLEDLGFEPCSKKVLGAIVATPCTLQKLRFDEDKNKVGPRVIDAVLPDYITLDFDEELRFPNGRTPWEPISDKVFALGFLKMGGKCSGIDTQAGVPEEVKRRVPRDDDGVPLCTVETFADMRLQVAENDRPFFKNAFPYLARPWFYPTPEAGVNYFWPKANRMETAE